MNRPQCPTCGTEYWSQARHKRSREAQERYNAANPQFAARMETTPFKVSDGELPEEMPSSKDFVQERKVDLISELGALLTECNMQVTFTGWKAELESCEKKLVETTTRLQAAEEKLAEAEDYLHGAALENRELERKLLEAQSRAEKAEGEISKSGGGYQYELSEAIEKLTAAQEEARVLREALEKIADPRKRHSEPDKYTELGCVMNIASEALARVSEVKE